jgi:hypothetical protein
MVQIQRTLALILIPLRLNQVIQAQMQLMQIQLSQLTTLNLKMWSIVKPVQTKLIPLNLTKRILQQVQTQRILQKLT